MSWHGTDVIFDLSLWHGSCEKTQKKALLKPDETVAQLSLQTTNPIIFLFHLPQIIDLCQAMSTKKRGNDYCIYLGID